MNFIKFLFLLLIIYSCNSTRSVQNNKRNVHKIKKNDSIWMAEVNDSIWMAKVNDSVWHAMFDTAVFTYNKNRVLQRHIRKLKSDLKMDKLSDFICDECLDTSEIAYCIVNSHETISLRTDIISNLEKEEIHKILEIGNKQKLKRKCNNNLTSKLFNGDKSTYEILMEALSRRHTKQNHDKRVPPIRQSQGKKGTS